MAEINTPKKYRAPYSLDEKKRLCEAWQKTGLSRNKFIRKNGLPSSFHEWCNTLLTKSVTDRPKPTNLVDGWLQVVPGGATKNQLQDEQIAEAIDFKLMCKDITLSFCMPLEKIITFVKELSHAAATIR